MLACICSLPTHYIEGDSVSGAESTNNYFTKLEVIKNYSATKNMSWRPSWAFKNARRRKRKRPWERGCRNIIHLGTGYHDLELIK